MPVAVAAAAEALAMLAAFITAGSAFLTICTLVGPLDAAFRPAFSTVTAISPAFASLCPSFRPAFGAPFSPIGTPLGAIGPAFSAFCPLFGSRRTAILNLDNRLLELTTGFSRRYGAENACRQRQSACQPGQKLEFAHWEPPFLETAARPAAN